MSSEVGRGRGWILLALVVLALGLRLLGLQYGLPAVYNTFFGYDEVAHHSGIAREDSLKVLATLDKIFAHLERVARGDVRAAWAEGRPSTRAAVAVAGPADVAQTC